MQADELVRGLSRHVNDERVLAAIAEVPRDLFVPPDLRSRAWDNEPLPIGAGQTISQPLVVGRMCELLALRGDERVLDVGTGSGWHAALLARLAREVVSIERHRALSEQAGRNLAAAGVENVRLVVGDGSLGLHEPDAPYDAINVAARRAAAACRPRWRSSSRSAAGSSCPPSAGEQRLVLVRKRADGSLERRALEPVRFVPLVSD